jgi:hypothetical protein
VKSVGRCSLCLTVSKGALQVELSVTGNVTRDRNIRNSNQFLLIIGYQQIT